MVVVANDGDAPMHDNNCRVPALPDLDAPSAQLAAVACAGAGFLLMGLGGWLGGRLVYEFGIAVRARKP